MTTQKDNKHTQKMSKDTQKYSKATPKNQREQGSKLLKENGSDISESVSEKACKRGGNREEKNRSSTEILKNSARAKNKNLRGERGGKRTATHSRTAKGNALIYVYQSPFLFKE